MLLTLFLLPCFGAGAPKPPELYQLWNLAPQGALGLLHGPGIGESALWSSSPDACSQVCRPRSNLPPDSVGHPTCRPSHRLSVTIDQMLLPNQLFPHEVPAVLQALGTPYFSSSLLLTVAPKPPGSVTLLVLLHVRDPSNLPTGKNFIHDEHSRTPITVQRLKDILSACFQVFVFCLLGLSAVYIFTTDFVDFIE